MDSLKCNCVANAPHWFETLGGECQAVEDAKWKLAWEASQKIAESLTDGKTLEEALYELNL